MSNFEKTVINMFTKAAMKDRIESISPYGGVILIAMDNGETSYDHYGEIPSDIAALAAVEYAHFQLRAKMLPETGEDE